MQNIELVLRNRIEQHRQWDFAPRSVLLMFYWQKKNDHALVLLSSVPELSKYKMFVVFLLGTEVFAWVEYIEVFW